MSTLENGYNVTPTDVVLARHYYPLLVQIAQTKTVTTYADFVDMAKTKYPDVPEIQSAIPVSTGRRLAHVRRFTAKHNLPDLSAWITGATGKAGDAFLAVFDPRKEQEDCEGVNWPEYEDHFEDYIKELNKSTLKIRRRKLDEALLIMNQYAKKIRPTLEKHIPNPKKIRYSSLVQPYREPLLELLQEGFSVEEAFRTAIFENVSTPN